MNAIRNIIPGLLDDIQNSDAETAEQNLSRIIVGDALNVLQSQPSDFFQCCVTSPPYWGLRDYGNDDQIGAEASIEQYASRLVSIFGEVRRVLRPDGTLWLNIGDSYTSGNRTWRAPDKKTARGQ